MSINIAINGYGRIGRCVLRALYENYSDSDIKVVAINTNAPSDLCAHLTEYDSVHGKFPVEMMSEGDYMIIDKDNIKVLSERNPENLPWSDMNIDLVLECTGKFNNHLEASKHLSAGAKKVLLSGPGDESIDKTIVYGINSDTLRADDLIVSNSSCTTNCLAPIAKVINNKFGIESGLVNTIHAYTNDQCIIDSSHSDWRRARAANCSLIPTKTGAAKTIGKIIPELNNKLDGLATRAPTSNVSILDLTFIAKSKVTIEELNKEIVKASEEMYPKILNYNEKPLVSIDFNHRTESSIVDITQTKTCGNLIKILSWYDNEWGFSNRMLDTAKLMTSLK